MKKQSPFMYALGIIFLAFLTDLITSVADNSLIHFGICVKGNDWCFTEKKLLAVAFILGVGAVITGYNYTFGDKIFRIKLEEFIKIPKSENIRLYPKTTGKNKVILKIQNFEWRWLPYIPVFVFIKPVESLPAWDGDFSKLDFRNDSNDTFVNLYWLRSKELNFIKINPRENAFYLDSGNNGNIKFSFGKSHRFVVKIFCQSNEKTRVFRESELVINCKGGHQVELEIKNDPDDNKSKSRKFFYKQRHFQNGGGG